MSRLSASQKELLRQCLIGLCAAIVFVCAKAWPDYSYAIWGVFLAAIALSLFKDLRKPVNYDSIVIEGDTIEYCAFGQRKVFRLSEVTKIYFVREEALFPDLDGPYIESKWDIRTADGAFIEMMDEWPHRRKLLRTFKKHLYGFNRQVARAGFRARGEGRWLCFERQ
jgi:hypothetical protein